MIQLLHECSCFRLNPVKYIDQSWTHLSVHSTSVQRHPYLPRPFQSNLTPPPKDTHTKLQAHQFFVVMTGQWKSQPFDLQNCRVGDT